MNEAAMVESGNMGRVAYARIAPNEDLVLGVEKLCLAHGFRHAFVRGALGSLVDACLETQDGKYLQIKGPAAEIVSLAGEVRSQEDGTVRAALTGVVADLSGNVFGGPFVAGANPVCMTFEVTLEEWLPASETCAASAGVIPFPVAK
ncbi:DNA-binding protein [Herbaspirillum lusitanum]|jgi:predicted DNA-binding protein with PD1-like motif|uniref:DNA-binding protein n=1 Tax=Herbaspirillum lusitanum TaxID=213312 RepID=A0ABW9A7N9_9BURK